MAAHSGLVNSEGKPRLFSSALEKVGAQPLAPAAQRAGGSVWIPQVSVVRVAIDVACFTCDCTSRAVSRAVKQSLDFRGTEACSA